MSTNNKSKNKQKGKSQVCSFASLIVFIVLFAGVWCFFGHRIHLKQGNDALNAWGTYLTGGATLLLSLAANFGGLIAVQDYKKKVTAEKAQWLLQLYEKLFEDSRFKEVRRLLDYNDTAEIKALIQTDRENQEFTPDQQVKFDRFTDYLNFFELIAHLEEVGQLNDKDIQATFDYYLKLLTTKRNPEIRQYLKKEGFENLDRLLEEEYEN